MALRQDGVAAQPPRTNTGHTVTRVVCLPSSPHKTLWPAQGGGAGGVFQQDVQQGAQQRAHAAAAAEAEEEAGSLEDDCGEYEDDFHNDTPLGDDTPATHTSSLSPGTPTISSSCRTNDTQSMLHDVTNLTNLTHALFR